MTGPTLTHGHLLDGRVVHAQPLSGHRTGIEPVLLAASIPARPGQRVLEAGTGSGAALLCLAHRVPGIAGVGVERDPEMADIARRNIAANGLSALEIVTADLAASTPPGPFDHAFANPPWHAPDATASPDALRDGARRADIGLFGRWIGVLAAKLKSRGTLTLITSAASLSDCVAALEAVSCRGLSVFPCWPRAGVAAKIVILRAIRDGRGPCRILPGLVLHGEGQAYTDDASRILRDGAALEF